MIDKSQTDAQVMDALSSWSGDDVIGSPDILVYAIGDCLTCNGKGVLITPDTVGAAFAVVLNKGKGAGVPHLTCPDCPDNPGKERVRVIPEATLRRLVRRARWPYSASDYEEDLLIAQLIEEFDS